MTALQKLARPFAHRLAELSPVAREAGAFILLALQSPDTMKSTVLKSALLADVERFETLRGGAN